MDRKLIAAENHIVGLEFQLEAAENQRLALLERITSLEEQLSDARLHIATAGNVLEEVGLRNSDGTLNYDIDKIVEVRMRLERGTHLEIMEKANKENPMIADAWNRYMAALRLCGQDGSND